MTNETQLQPYEGQDAGFLNKTNAVISTAVRNTSCSQGWLRVMVQTVFGLITVASFILIVLMATPVELKKKPKEQSSRCVVVECSVICSSAPFFDKHEEDIIISVEEAEAMCDSISLTLNRPKFVNNTIPKHWFSHMYSDIKELTIIGGNLQHIESDAFISEFTKKLNILILENIVLSKWNEHTLAGLSNLITLIIKDSKMEKLTANALRPVAETLASLSATSSFSWQLEHLTGSSYLYKLEDVDFSYNIFEVIRKDSFTKIEKCRSLDLSSCYIIAIESGSFDFLPNIELINLNNNFLATIPHGLFDSIIIIGKFYFKIDLDNNPWYCDCSQPYLMKLHKKGFLLGDPQCHYPEEVQGYSFPEFNIMCNGTENNSTYHSDKEQVYVTNACHMSAHLKTAVMISPVPRLSCSRVRAKHSDMELLSKDDFQSNYHSDWLQLNFLINEKKFNMLEVKSTGSEAYGLVWRQSTCPKEIYCMKVLPTFLRVYNVNTSAKYTFCPISMRTGKISQDACVAHAVLGDENVTVTTAMFQQLFLYILIATTFLFIGATCVFYIIRKNPSLLKGNKRVLIVKHKTIDALIIPPKVPLRNTTNEERTNKSNVFTVPYKRLFPETFKRSISTRSNVSTPSYVSAFQPTDEQLADWRYKHSFDDVTVHSYSSLSTLSWICDKDCKCGDKNDTAF